MSDSVVVGLAEAIAQIRDDLAIAMASGKNHDVRFRLGQVELELELEISREGGGDGGVRLGVVTIGAHGGMSTARVHRVRLILEPINALGERATVRDRLAERPD
ncbi:MAG: trypco2 family protein [Egibacteraceae bacterium]